eukprot:Colp12_sorted_trinity150504_noHs@24170
MSVYKVAVKWGKQKYDVELDVSEPPLVFKSQLFALTGVPVERQKIMVKGGILKDDQDWAPLNIKEGHNFMLMGTAEKLKEPEAKTVFAEDLSAHQLAAANNLPVGFVNLGNTCYMNATLQCLRSAAPLQHALQKYNDASSDPAKKLTVALRDAFRDVEKAGQPYPPFNFLMQFRNIFPQFAQMGPGGVPAQQDAEECWTELVRVLQNTLPGTSADSMISQYFTGKLETRLKLAEGEGEEETVSEETFVKLSCHISKDVNFMLPGIQESLQEVLSKQSPSLGREAEYKRTSLVSRLPAYLTVGFVRFFWKPSEKVKAKILRNVKFPLLLDAFELCTPELKERLKPVRELYRQAEDLRIEAQKKKTLNEEAEKPMQLELPSNSDEGSNQSGYYELQAVLTHMGRSADSGHYVAWVRTKGDDWLKYDDDKVTPCDSEEILKLSGGADSHIAYLLLYGPRPLPH